MVRHKITYYTLLLKGPHEAACEGLLLGDLLAGTDGRVHEGHAQLGHQAVLLLAVRTEVQGIARKHCLHALEGGKGDLGDNIIVEFLDDAIRNIGRYFDVLSFAWDFRPQVQTK